MWAALVAAILMPPRTPAAAPGAVAPAAVKAASSTPRAAGCLAGGDGYLRARLRGALDLDLAWRDAEMDCDGGARPDGRGLRVTVAGPITSGGRRLRFVFGIAETPEGTRVTARAVNLTVIFEGEQRMFVTRGDGKCTVDELEQQRVGAPGGTQRTWRVVARGFCTSPALTVDGTARLLVSRFDFASRVTFGDS